MPINTALLGVGATAMASAVTHLSLHTAQPDGTGSNESTADREAVSLSVDGDDFETSSPVAFTGGAASGPCTHVGLWSASTGGTFYGYAALTGDQTFNAAGEYTVSTFTVNGSSS